MLRSAGGLQPTNNLSDLTTRQAARDNLGGYPFITQRSPRASDDSTLGHAIGDLWLCNGDLYQANQVTAGQASWSKVTGLGKTLPLDLVSVGAGGAAYGTVLLRNAYAGQAFNVTRASDSTSLDIGFINGQLDVASLDAFLANTTGAVGTWYDQSGNALDATQATAANRPVVNPSNSINGIRPITFDSNTHAIANLAAKTKYLTLPVGVAVTPRTTTSFFAGQTHNTAEQSCFGTFGSNTTKMTANGAGTTSRIDGMMYQGGISNVPMPVQPSVSVFRGKGAGISTADYYNNNRSALAVTASVSNSALTGGTIGSSLNDNGGGPSIWDAQAVIIYPSSLSVANTNLVQQSLHVLLNIPPQSHDIVVFDGDSSSMGTGTTTNAQSMRQTLRLLDRPVQAYCIARFGNLIASQGANFAAFYQTSNIYQSTARNFVVHLLIGPNDIRAGADAATITANIAIYVAQIRALGSNVRIVLGTPFLQTDIAANGSWLAVENTLVTNILAGTAGVADAYANYRNDPTIGAGIGNNTSALTSSTLAIDVAQHLTDYGQSFFAQGAATAINAVWK